MNVCWQHHKELMAKKDEELNQLRAGNACLYHRVLTSSNCNRQSSTAKRVVSVAAQADMQARHEAAMEALRQRAQSSSTTGHLLFSAFDSLSRFLCVVIWCPTGNEELLKKQAMEALQVRFVYV